MGTLGVVTLTAPAIASAGKQTVAITLLISIRAVSIAAVVGRVVNASRLIDAIAIAVTITIPITVSVAMTMPMAVAVTIPVAVAISIAGQVRFADYDAIAFTVLVDAIAVATAAA